MSIPLEEIARHDPRLLKPLEAFASQKLNCTQAVMLPFIEDLPKEAQDVVLDMSPELGGGVANLGYVCGGLLGGIMALSRELAKRQVAPENRQKLIDGFIKTFTSKYGSHFCSGITWRDRGTKKAFEACRYLVVETIDTIDKILLDLDQEK